MRTADRTLYVTFALIALASLAGIGSVAAQDESARARHEQRSSEGQRQAARRQARARLSQRAHAAQAAAAHSAARRGTSRRRTPPVANYHQELVGRGSSEQRLTESSSRRETDLRDRRGREAYGLAAGQLHVVRFGNAVSGTVDRTIRPGLVNRTFVRDGHVLYAHVYQRQVWHQYGRAFAYETFVPAVRYPAPYYAWALAAWPRPLTYNWGWQVQAWYPMYGSLFTPYPVYTSPDLWMTDYIIAQSMQTAYQTQPVTPAPATATAPEMEPPSAGPAAVPAPAPNSSSATPTAEPTDTAPAAQPNDAPPAPQTTDTPSTPATLPPAITPQVKAQLNAEIKVQLQEQADIAATPASPTTPGAPPALKPNHVFFQVVEPLNVPSGSGNRYCSLSSSDYIKRIGGMSDEDWMIPIVVELSGPSDCPEGLRTRIGLNDLTAMENQQEAQVMEAMQAASKSMGPNGPPSGPGVHPTLIAEGSAAPDPSALSAIQKTQ